MINSAYSTGGPELVRDTLKANFDIDINHYLEVDFQSFQEIVNEIGNVRVYLPGRVRDLETRNAEPVRRRLLRRRRRHGARLRALAQPADLRPRRRLSSTPRPASTGASSTSVPTSTASPASSTFIRKLAGLAISRALGDPFLAVSLADNVLGYLKADQTLSRDDVNALVRAFKTVDVNDPNSVRFETLAGGAVPGRPEPAHPVARRRRGGRAAAHLRRRHAEARDGAAVAGDGAVSSTPPAPTSGRRSVEGARRPGVPGHAGRRRATTIAVTEIRYGYGQAEEAKALLDLLPRRQARARPDGQGRGAARARLVVPRDDHRAVDHHDRAADDASRARPSPPRPPLTTTHHLGPRSHRIPARSSARTLPIRAHPRHRRGRSGRRPRRRSPRRAPRGARRGARRARSRRSRAGRAGRRRVRARRGGEHRGDDQRRRLRARPRARLRGERPRRAHARAGDRPSRRAPRARVHRLRVRRRGDAAPTTSGTRCTRSRSTAARSSAESWRSSGTRRSWATVRTSWVFGRRGTDLVSWAFGAFDRGELDGVLADQVSIPTYAPDLAVLLARFAVERRQGLFHVTSGSEARHPPRADRHRAAGARRRPVGRSRRSTPPTSTGPRPARR